MILLLVTLLPARQSGTVSQLIVLSNDGINDQPLHRHISPWFNEAI